MLALDMPGTTRDSIYIPFKVAGKQYIIIDTAGIRRKKSTVDKIEIFSIIKTIKALEKADVAVLVLDAHSGITAQDASLLGLIVEKNCAFLLVVNKCDGTNDYKKQEIRRQLELKLSFANCTNIHFISALYGSGVGSLYASINKAYDNSSQHFSTAVLNKVLVSANKKHQAPSTRGRKIRLKFVTQVANRPLTFVIYGNKVTDITNSYHRYLVNFFKKTLSIDNTPIVLKFSSGDNPYKDKKNILNKRQRQKRLRMIKFVKK